MGLKKLLKKAKKVVKKGVKAVATVYPGTGVGSANKALKKVQKAVLPIATGAAGGAAISAMSNGMPSGLSNFLGGAENIAGGLMDAIKKAQQIGDILEGNSPKAVAPGAVPQQQFAPGVSPALVLGAVGVLAVIVLAKKG